MNPNPGDGQMDRTPETRPCLQLELENRNPNMKRSDVFKSKYLSKDDVDGDVTAEITDFRIETLQTQDSSEEKGVVVFDGLKSLVLNQVNWDTIADLHGDDSDDWIGKRITLYVDHGVRFGKKKTGGIRIRPVTPQPVHAGQDVPEADVIPF